MRIYVASSWRNDRQPDVVVTLRAVGHDVYDFRAPDIGGATPGGFHWSEIDPNWRNWRPEQYLAALEHPLATHGCGRDYAALATCDACVLVLPCGRSAHLEFGHALGAGKRGYVLLDEREFAPFNTGDTTHVIELMYALAHGRVTSVDALLAMLGPASTVILAEETAARKRA